MTGPTSVFLEVPQSEWLSSNPLAFAIRDKHPVSKGHVLVVTRRLIPTWWDATIPERESLMMLVDEMKLKLDREFRPDGYNVGFNTGEAAGQTIPHLSVHIIPRYAEKQGTATPAGGIRGVVPDVMLASPKRIRRA